MAYTFLEFQDIVSRFVKVENKEPTQQLLIKDIINIALYEVARSQRWPELLKNRVTFSLVGVDAGGNVPLTPSVLDVDRVIFANFGKEWNLPERKGLIPPARVLGKPRCYYKVQGTLPNPISLFIEPFDAVDVIFDQIFIDYFSAPTLLVANSDTPQSNMWDTEIIRKAEQLYLIHNGKIPNAAAVLQQMQAATQAAEQK